MSHHSRRSFLQGSLGCAALLPLTSSLVRAAPGGAKRVVVLLAKGAWDVTYVFDPKDPSDTAVEANIDGPWRTEAGGDIDWDDEQIAEWGNLRFAHNELLRPSVGDFFSLYGDRCAVVNGISMGSLVHDVCRVRILTGTRVDTSPDIGALAGFANQGAAALGYIDFAGEGFVGDLAASSGKVGNRGQLELLIDDTSGPLVGPDGADWDYPLYLPDSSDEDAVQEYLLGRAQRFGDRWTDETASKRLAELALSKEGARALRDEADSLSASISLGQQLSISRQAALAMEMFESDLCRAVLLESGMNWDTHDDNTEQGDHFENLFAGLTGFADLLDGAGMLDDTLVVVLSEFTRTPKLNSTNGKDHWPVSSALLFGAGIEGGGRTLGGTDHLLEPEAVDLSTGEVDSAGEVPTYANLIAGILEILDVDSTEHFQGVTPYTGIGV